uniref:Uncharacterized protein n=1 Tax=Anguilla anguilla TaxID=7936 RepID=A0A0E9S5P8_ANGAN
MLSLDYNTLSEETARYMLSYADPNMISLKNSRFLFQCAKM